MGQDEHKIGLATLEDIKCGKITRNYFDFLYIIGKGGFGKVRFYKIKKLYHE